jgi:carboxyl-terminal processing protease
MGLKRKVGGLRQSLHSHKWLQWTYELLLLAIIFLAGLGLGNGWFGRHVPWGTKPVTSGLPANLDYSSVNQVYQVLKQNYDGKLTETQLLDGLKHGLAQATNDPYTEYFTTQETKAFNDEVNNAFSGIGAELGEDSSGDLQVIAPISGAPAAQAGLKAQDLITAINGASTSGISVDDAVAKIRGPADTKVTLQIVRNQSQTLNFTITRQNITVPTVTTKILPNNVGYMQISTFGGDTSTLAQKAADQFKQAHVKGIILDLRNNPGGLVNAAIDVSSLWLPKGQTILQERRGTTVVDTNYATGNDELRGLPAVVLINDGSASASEITAGALHDNGAAYIIGQKSYGKGVVQEPICITGQTKADGTCPADELKVTIASWYRPNGQNINHRGITPDKTVKISDTDLKAGIDTQLQAAQAYLANK